MTDLNEELKIKTRKCYTYVKSSFDPKGHVVDTLFEKGIITVEQLKEMNGGPDQERRAENVLSHLFQTSHPQAFVVFRDALRKNHDWIVEMIDGEGPQKAPDQVSDKLVSSHSSKDAKQTVTSLLREMTPTKPQPKPTKTQPTVGKSKVMPSTTASTPSRRTPPAMLNKKAPPKKVTSIRNVPSVQKTTHTKQQSHARNIGSGLTKTASQG